MGEIYASCGHQITNRWMMDKRSYCHWKDISTDYDAEKIVNVVSCGIMCPKCKRRYERKGYLLHSEQEEKDWMELR